MDFQTLKIRLPDWLYSYFEVGWMRYEQGLEGFFSVEGKKFDSFEEYVEGVIEELVRADFSRFKKIQREGLKSLDQSIENAWKRGLEKEALKKDNLRKKQT